MNIRVEHHHGAWHPRSVGRSIVLAGEIVMWLLMGATSRYCLSEQVLPEAPGMVVRAGTGLSVQVR